MTDKVKDFSDFFLLSFALNADETGSDPLSRQPKPREMPLYVFNDYCCDARRVLLQDHPPRVRRSGFATTRERDR